MNASQIIMNKIAGECAWTVLIYAAGNNDLEAYIYDSLQRLSETVGLDDINIIMQISQSSPGEMVVGDATVRDEQWHGTRLYVIKERSAILVGDLGELDMAEPKTLLNFLIWGATRFPARRLMLIMSGHSAGFVGMMKDHSGENAAFMGIPGFAKALGLFQQSLKRKIDILLFDTCFMDMVETWHEITVTSRSAVKFAILPQNNPPMQGLPYHLMIKQLQPDKDDVNLPRLLGEIVTAFNRECRGKSQVFAINISEEYFIELKNLTDRLAELLLATDIDLQQLLQDWILKHDKQDFISLFYFLDQLDTSYPYLKDCNQEMREVLDAILLCPSSRKMDLQQNVGLKIYIPSSAHIYHKFKDVYQQMLFTHDNKWAMLLQESYPLVTTKHSFK